MVTCNAFPPLFQSSWPAPDLLSCTPSLTHPPKTVLGLGTWRSDKGKVKDAVLEALRVGYVHVDAAQVYENQEEVGEGLHEAKSKGFIKDFSDVWITSKLWNTDHRPEHVRPACDRILRELKINKIQQLLIHWPTGFKRVDDATFWPKDEEGKHAYDVEADNKATWREMEKLVDEGLVETIGLSNFNEEEVQKILDVARIKPVCNQIECHPFLPQDEMRAFLHSKGMALVAYSPLANLDPNDTSKPCALKDDTILSLATKHLKSPAQIILRWHAQKKNVFIPKSVTLSRISENKEIFDFELSEEEMGLIGEMGKKHRSRLVNPGFRAGGAQVFKQ